MKARLIGFSAMIVASAIATLVDAGAADALVVNSRTGTTYDVRYSQPFIGCQGGTIWTQDDGIAPTESGWNGFGRERLTVNLFRWSGTGWGFVGGRYVDTVAAVPFDSVSFPVSAGSYAVTLNVAWFAEPSNGGGLIGRLNLTAQQADLAAAAPNTLGSYQGVGYCTVR